MHLRGIAVRLALGCAIALLAQGCESPMSPGPLAAGTWGGDHAGLTVTNSGAHLEFDCASGDITQPLIIDGAGRFAVAGLFVQEHPGPVSQGPDPKAALYSGQIMRATMTLTVTLVESSTAVGSFVLIRNTEPQVHKCT